MEIVFNQVGRTWQAEFTVTADFNLHIERPATGFMYLSQRTGDSGEYATAHTFADSQFVYDYDFTALVYPKSIKIVSEVEPVSATLTLAPDSGNTGGGGSADDNVLFFAAQPIYEYFGVDMFGAFQSLLGRNSFINKTTYYADWYGGKSGFSEGYAVSNLDPQNVAAIAVSNSYISAYVFMGSGEENLPFEGESITFYEFMDMLAELGYGMPDFRSAEITKEQVLEWLNAQ